MFEVKLTGARGETVKQRVPHPAEDSAELTAGALAHLRTALCQAYQQDLPPGLRPTLATTYRRTTFVSRNGESRLTCDVGLVCLDVRHEVRDTGTHVLVESKSAGRGSAPDRILRELGVRPASVSKYCVGVAALHPELPSNPWHQTLQRYFEPRAVADLSATSEIGARVHAGNIIDPGSVHCGPSPRSSRWPRRSLLAGCGGRPRRRRRAPPVAAVAPSARPTADSTTDGVAPGTLVMVIRHGEKPEDDTTPGIDANGNEDESSMTQVGWDRAHRLVELFDPAQGALRPGLARPQAIYAAGANDNGEGQRTRETVTPARRPARHPGGHQLRQG